MTPFEQRMAEFRARFLERAATDAQDARAALANGDFAALHAICHGLSGNAGMFGFDDLGTRAQSVEEAVDAAAPDAQVRALAEQLLDGLAALTRER